MGKAYGAGSFRHRDYGCFAKCCGCQEHRMHCQMFLQVLILCVAAETTLFFLGADAVEGRERSGAFDTVWPSATKMGTGLTIPSLLSLAPQHTAKPQQSQQQKLTIP
jgi:hypothetical protein